MGEVVKGDALRLRCPCRRSARALAGCEASWRGPRGSPLTFLATMTISETLKATQAASTPNSHAQEAVGI